MGYTKLHASIVQSTIWFEPYPTRIVWITMLAIADKNGEVQATIPGLARTAGVTLAECEAALKLFMAPDAYSRTKDDEGRRIEAIEGGWALLNHAKYRALASKEESQQANAERQARHKAKRMRNESAGNAKVTQGNASEAKSNASQGSSNGSVTHHRDIAEAEAEAEAGCRIHHDTSKPSPAPTPEPDCPAITDAEIYAAYPRKVAKQDAIKAIANARKRGVTAEALLSAVQAYASAVAAWPEADRTFVPHPSTWFNRGSYEDDPKTWQRRGIGRNGTVSEFANAF